MSAEALAISAIVARLANPEINLAAYGGLVFPIAVLIESPIMMLLAASTALSKDLASYRKLRSFTLCLCIGLSVIYALIAFTPLYYVVAAVVMHAPPEIVAPGRVGLMIMLPWTFVIAYRRFNQGVLIRFGYSLDVGLGTLVRLLADGGMLAFGYITGLLPGIALAAGTATIGAVCELIYIAIRVRPVLRKHLKAAPSCNEGLTFPAIVGFYFPLSLMSSMLYVMRPIMSAGISRMPEALGSLAVLPVATGIVSLLRSIGASYNEVVVVLLDQPGSSRNLHRFALFLIGLVSVALLLVVLTPFAVFWFARLSGLSASLARLGRISLCFAIALPALSVLQGWLQGTIIHSGRTRSISEAILIYSGVTGAVLAGGIAWGNMAGLYVGFLAMSLGELARTLWLWWRSRAARRTLCQRDTAGANHRLMQQMSFPGHRPTTNT